MIDLGQRSGPYEIALPYGLSITMKPFTSAGMPVAQDAARRAVEAIEPHAREHTPRLAARFIQCDQVEPSRWAAERLFRKPRRNAPAKAAGMLAPKTARDPFRIYLYSAWNRPI